MMLLQSAGFKRIFILLVTNYTKIRRSNADRVATTTAHGGERMAFGERADGARLDA
jgi:hypothetical protein